MDMADELELTDEMDVEMEESFEQMLDMTSEDTAATKQYLDSIESDDAIGELEQINQELQGIKLKAGEYLTATLTWKERLAKADALEDNQTKLQRMVGYGKAILGLRESYENMPISQQLNYLFADFQDFIGVIMEIREDVTKKRSDCDKHMTKIRGQLKQSIPRLESAEAQMVNLQKLQEQLEEKIQAELTPAEKYALDEEKDLLHNSWLEARKELRASTYLYNLSDNVMETVRVYRGTLDVLIEEAEALQHDINLTTNTIKPLMKTIVSGAKIAEALTKGLDSYKILKAVVNPVLAKTGEISAVIPEVRRKVMDGNFIDARVQTHLEECYVRARLVQNYGVMQDLQDARQKLKDRGIKYDSEQLDKEIDELGGAGPDDYDLGDPFLGDDEPAAEE